MTIPSARMCAAALAVAVLLGSCESPRGSRADYGVHAIQFQDVVVPADLELQADKNQSYSLEASGYRQAHFEYLGSTPVAQATSYVLARMPQHDWTTVADAQPTPASRILRFERGRYRADYSFQRREGVTHMVVDYQTATAER